MTPRKAILVSLAAALTIAAAAGAGPGSRTQRVAIFGHGVAASPNAAKFTFMPLQAGSLRRDTMTESSDLGQERTVMRDGQELTIYPAIVETFTGKLGTLVIRTRNEYAEAGSGYHVGFITWKVVRGTGQYANVKGGGRGGTVWLDSGPWSGRREGLLTR
jgi:hypothetical protein